MSCLGTEAIDLSLKPLKDDFPSICRPTPRPAWSILWYQSLWPTSSTIALATGDNSTSRNSSRRNSYVKVGTLEKKTGSSNSDIDMDKSREESAPKRGQSMSQSESEHYGEDPRFTMDLENGQKDLSGLNVDNHMAYIMSQGFGSSIVLDVASCDGPVRFERVSNPNFALTVEHHQNHMKPASDSGETTLTLSSRTYICIYCKQGFKSLFCYQKHKKRHLNPVSVDITAASTVQASAAQSETTSQTRDLNVQFFPCKECGCKFPSYYFVHKHKKICHK